MSAQTPIVDENGDIFLHGRQGAILTLEFQNGDGSLRDMSSANVTFEVGPTINHTLAVVSGTPSQMTLTLSNADVKAIYNLSGNREFVFLDNSGSEPTPVWVGTIYVQGWIE